MEMDEIQQTRFGYYENNYNGPEMGTAKKAPVTILLEGILYTIRQIALFLLAYYILIT